MLLWKETMRRVDGLYGAEMSAHHFFRDFSYCDSGMILAFGRQTDLRNRQTALSQLIADMEARSSPAAARSIASGINGGNAGRRRSGIS